MTVAASGGAARIGGFSCHGYAAVVFDLDGVLTDTASLHEKAWTETFASVAGRLGEAAGGLAQRPFDHTDYVRLVDGEQRLDGARHVLADRGVELPEGADGDPPGAMTVHGLAAAKDSRYLELLAAEGPRPYQSARPLLEQLRTTGIDVAVVSASRHCIEVLRAAGLDDLVDVVVDGLVAAAAGLPGKPDPATYLEAAARLGVDPERAVVVEDALAGVQAGERGGFGLVVGVDHHGSAHEALRRHGAGVVVADVGDIPSVDAWTAERSVSLVFDDPAPEYEGAIETLTTLGNGYIATRGARAWSHDDGISYPGTYAAGVYNRLRSEAGSRDEEWESLVNLPNWLVASVRPADGAWLGEASDDVIVGHRLRLDLDRCVLVRRCVVSHADGRRTAFIERRLVCMADRHLVAQELSVVPDWSGPLELRVGIDANVVSDETVEGRLLANHHLDPVDEGFEDGGLHWVRARTIQSQILVAMASRCQLTSRSPRPEPASRHHREPGRVVDEISLDAVKGVRLTIEKIAAVYISRDRAISEPGVAAREAARAAPSFADLAGDQRRAWRRLWERSSLEVTDGLEVGVEGSSGLDAGHALTLHLFHLLQVASPHLAHLDAGIGARGLHGEGYRGHIFWDTVFVSSVLNLQYPEVARAALDYRYRRLPAARRAAEKAGLRGALFPWQSGSDGRDETPRVLFNPASGHWIPDNSRLERHIGLAIAYEAWQHWQATGDLEYLATVGAELIVEVARCFTAMSTLDPALGRRHITGVMGPDEFHDRYPWTDQPGLDDNAYTNVMTSWVLWRAHELVALLVDEDMVESLERLDLDPGEPAHWDEISRQLYLPFHDGVISQFAGYEQLKPIDLAAYRQRYGDIGRLDLILESEGDSANRYQVSKQADVLMLFYLFSADELRAVLDRMGYEVEPQLIPRTVRYYTDRVTHGSSLSKIIHAWVLARGDRQASWSHFIDALQVDLTDTRGGTTREGVHLGAMAGTVDMLQRCYTGLEVRGERLWLHPQLPAPLNRLRFKAAFRDHLLDLDFDRHRLRVWAAGSRGGPVTLMVNGEPVEVVAGQTVEVPL